MPRALKILLLAIGHAAVCEAVHAQLLNLDSPKAPAPGEGEFVLDLVADLTAQVERRERLTAGSAGEDAAAAVAARLQIEFRRLIDQVLRSGEDAGEGGSPAIVAGLTLVSAIEDIDSLAERIKRGDGSSMDLALLFLAETEATPWPESVVPQAVERELAHRLAPLIRAETSGKPAESASRALVDLMQKWRGRTPAPDGEQSRVSEAAMRDLEALASTLDQAGSWPVYEAAGMRLVRAIQAGDRSIDVLGGIVGPDGQRLLFERFSTVLSQAAQPPTRVAALAELALLTRSAELIARHDALPSPLRRPQASHEDPCHEAARSVLMGWLAGADTAALRVRWQALERIIGLLEESAPLLDSAGEQSLLKDVKPAWRSLVPEVRRTAAALCSAAPRLAATPQAMSDPELLGLIAAHQRALDDLLALRAISIGLLDSAAAAAPADGRPPTPEERETLAQQRIASSRTLLLCQGVMKGEMMEREESLAQLRRFAADIRRLAPTPAEAGLKKSLVFGGLEPQYTAAWKAVTSGGANAEPLVRQLDDLRARWFDAWGEEGGAGGGGGKSGGGGGRQVLGQPLRGSSEEIADRLRSGLTLARLMDEVVHVQATLGTPGGEREGLNALPWWESQHGTVQTLLGDGESGAAATLSGLSSHMLAGRWDETSVGIERFEREQRLLTLIGKLAGASAAAGVRSPGALAEVCGLVDCAALNLSDEERGMLVRICRYATEQADAIKKGDPRRAERLTRFVSILAEEFQMKRFPD